MTETERLTIENAKHVAFLRAIQQALDTEGLQADTVWFSVHTTLFDAIDCHLDNPIARGERPLFEAAS